MRNQPYDTSGKWLVGHRGKALATVGGVVGVASCRSVQSETVQSAQLPDGLLEVTLAGQAEPALLLIEFCTYPESRVPEQLADDIMMVRQVKKVLPDLLAFVLRPQGKAEVPAGREERSRLGFTRANFGWKVVELWKLDTEEMLACPDVGVVPLVPRMRFAVAERLTLAPSPAATPLRPACHPVPSSGRQQPSSRSVCRRATRIGSFIARTWTVTRPMGVRPTRRTPSQRKW